jgi:TatD DNase family protein
MLVDVHAHLDHPLIEKRLNEIISNSEKTGVKAIITNGINHKTNLKSLEISEKYSIVKCAMGFYPQDALKKEIGEDAYPNSSEEEGIDKEIMFIEKHKDKIIAIGEVGLDYHNGHDKEKQKEDFSKIIALSLILDKPLIVHSRKAEEDVIEILEEKKARKVVLHCFSGKKSLVKRASKNGWSFSIPANIVRAENFQMIVKEVPLSQILTETDAPYLSPFKDKINEPAFIAETIKKIAEIKQMTVQDVEQNIYMNYQKMFL